MKLKKWNNTLVYLHQIVPVRDYPRKVASTRKRNKSRVYDLTDLDGTRS